MKEIMIQASQKRWLIDAALFTGFLTCFFLDLTGMPLHQWLGIVAEVVAASHLASYWSWVRAVACQNNQLISWKSLDFGC